VLVEKIDSPPVAETPLRAKPMRQNTCTGGVAAGCAHVMPVGSRGAHVSCACRRMEHEILSIGQGDQVHHAI